MTYNQKAIGKRIKEERIAAGFSSQSAFAKRMTYSPDSRTTIGNWEKGNCIPCMEDLLRMCEIFQCELGYILCEYGCKTRETTDIKNVTGLSQDAINRLSHMKNTRIHESISSLSKILEHKDFYDLLSAIHLHAIDFNHDKLRVDQDHIQSIANALNCREDEVKKYLESSSKSAIESIFLDIVKDIDLGYNKKRTNKRSSKA